MNTFLPSLCNWHEPVITNWWLSMKKESTDHFSLATRMRRESLRRATNKHIKAESEKIETDFWSSWARGGIFSKSLKIIIYFIWHLKKFKINLKINKLENLNSFSTIFHPLDSHQQAKRREIKVLPINHTEKCRQLRFLYFFFLFRLS